MRSVRTQCISSVVMSGAICLLLAVSGCSGQEEPVLALADGVVKINGQPASDIMVQFLPVVPEGDPGPTSSAVTDANGMFELQTDSGKQGAVVGTCKVIFIDTTEERPRQGEEPTRPPRIPSSLAMIGKSTKEVEVKEENTSFEFELGQPPSTVDPRGARD